MSPKPFSALTILLLFSLPAFLVNGCGGNRIETESHSLHMAPLAQMPEMVQTAPARTQQAYQFAVANAELTGQMPCYCGCGPIGHESLYDCYVAETAGDAVTYDFHAVNCKICVDITQDVMRLTQEGQDGEQIRPIIDEGYARYGPSNMP